jgi:hypothetical protein
LFSTCNKPFPMSVHAEGVCAARESPTPCRKHFLRSPNGTDWPGLDLRVRMRRLGWAVAPMSDVFDIALRTAGPCRHGLRVVIIAADVELAFGRRCDLVLVQHSAALTLGFKVHRYLGPARATEPMPEMADSALGTPFESNDSCCSRS